MHSSSVLAAIFIGKPLWTWLLFAAVIAILLALDLGIFYRTARKPKTVESLLGTVFYAGVAMLFGVFIWQEMSAQKALEYFTGYVMEQSLSLDNVFIISLIFSSLSTPSKYQRPVLFWGILSVLVLRGLMIGLGAALISQFHWVLSLFGIFLLFSGGQMFLSEARTEKIENNRLLKWLRAHLPITKELHGSRFFVVEENARGERTLWITPLLAVLILVELADIIFAVDSVPAVFAVTQDPYIVYTSNIFAILGLRTLYFSLAALVNRFVYLSKALSVVLVFIGGKILYAQFSGSDIPIQYSLGVVLLILLSGIGASLLKPDKKKA